MDQAVLSKYIVNRRQQYRGVLVICEVDVQSWRQFRDERLTNTPVNIPAKDPTFEKFDL